MKTTDEYEKCWKWPLSPWKSRSAWMNWLRGNFRKAWSRHPAKIAVLQAQRKKIPNPNPSSVTRFPTIWGADCSCCLGTFPLSGGKKEKQGKATIQVDHINQAGTFREVTDIQGFVERMFCVGVEDLRLVCSDCNKTLAKAFEDGTTFEEAKIEREAITIIKAKKDREWLIEQGLLPKSNQKLRRLQIVERLKENLNADDKTTN